MKSTQLIIRQLRVCLLGPVPFIYALLLWVSAALPTVSKAAPPPLREEISLNGEWEEGGLVPKYQGEKVDRKTYQRRVKVPAAWNGKHLELEFRQVNYAAKLYADDRLIGEHIGAWTPFTIDITPYVKAGAEFRLRVEVTSSTQPPYADDQGKPLWPVGTYNHDGSFAGIVDDVWLRAYGPVAIHDTFIRTSHRDNAIEVDYTLTNHDSVARTVQVTAEAIPAEGGTVAKSIQGEPVTLAAGETRKVRLRSPWPEAKRWMPDRPQLYHLRSQLLEARKTIDQETRRFGFREIWISGNQYMLNGIRVNLWGDSLPRSWTDARRITPQAWPATVDMLMKQLNLRILRWHQFPAADYLLEVADEKGLMIIEESALYARPWTHANQQTVINNMRTAWVPEWIRSHRNHPSIVLWSAENEDYKHVGGFQPEQLQTLSDAIRAMDPTRPVIHDGDEDLAGRAQTFNWHYPEGYEKLPQGSIYSWASKVHSSKPTGIGEFLACPWVENIKPQVFWWHGTWSRGLRYTNFTDIRPFVMTWAWDDKYPEARENLRRSFSPVALFDKDYDDLGIDPLLNKNYPSLAEGEKVTRKLVLYNDEYRDKSVTIEVMVKSGGVTYASGSKTLAVELGEHRDIACSFQVPHTGGKELELVLLASKGGARKFEEVKRFRITGAGPKSESSSTLEFSVP